jgi:hypothetical protein
MRINTTPIASSSRMWMNPPKVYEETIPRSQSTIKITKIVQSMAFLLSYFAKQSPSMKIGHAGSLAPKSRVAGFLAAGVNPHACLQKRRLRAPGPAGLLFSFFSSFGGRQ